MTPSGMQKQSMTVLEMDGIKCFDLNHSDLGKEDLRMSITDRSNLDLNESMHIFSDLEKMKKENQELKNFKSEMEKQTT